MVVSRNRRQPENMLEDPDNSNTDWLNGGEGPAIPDKDPRDDKIAAMEEMLKEMRERMEDNASDRLLTAVTTQQSRPVFTPDKEIELPDMETDLTGYIAAREKNVEVRLRNEQRKRDFDNSQSKTIEERSQMLMDDFAEKYPDLAEGGEKRIEYAATQVASRAHSRGVDVERYMFVTKDRYLKDVAKEYEAIFGAPDVEEDEEDDFEDVRNRRNAKTNTRTRKRTRNRRDRNRQEDDGNDGRTSVFGGNDSGGRPSGYEEEGGDMIDDFHKMQLKTGFF